MKRLESFCDALAQYHHYWNPESEAYELRNPGMLQGPDGKRRFSCHRAGYASLLDKVTKLCYANMDKPVSMMLESFGIKMKMQQDNALDFIARCANSTLNRDTKLRWFTEK